MFFGLEHLKTGLSKNCYWWHAYAAKIYFDLTEHVMSFGKFDQKSVMTYNINKNMFIGHVIWSHFKD